MYIHYKLSFTLPEVFLESDEVAELNEPDLYREKITTVLFWVMLDKERV